MLSAVHRAVDGCVKRWLGRDPAPPAAAPRASREVAYVDCADPEACAALVTAYQPGGRVVLDCLAFDDANADAVMRRVPAHKLVLDFTELFKP